MFFYGTQCNALIGACDTLEFVRMFGVRKLQLLDKL